MALDRMSSLIKFTYMTNLGTMKSSSPQPESQPSFLLVRKKVSTRNSSWKSSLKKNKKLKKYEIP